MQQNCYRNKFNNIDNPIFQKCVFNLFIRRESYGLISRKLLIKEDDVKKLLESRKYASARNSFDKLNDLKKEMRRRKSRSIQNPSPFKKKRVEKIWLSGKGKLKIMAETGYSRRFVESVIKDLVIKHGRPRADHRGIVGE